VNEGFLIGEFTPTQIKCARRGKHSVLVMHTSDVHNVHIHLTNSYNRFRIRCVKVLIKSYFKLQIEEVPLQQVMCSTRLQERGPVSWQSRMQTSAAAQEAI
jgi:hypothetical protein